MPNTTQIPEFKSDLDRFQGDTGISKIGDVAEIGLETEIKKSQFQQDFGEFQLDQPLEAGASAQIPGNVTQMFGNRNQIERFSGGVNYGTDFGVKEGTKVALPQGDWEVVDSFGEATKRGFIGDSTNNGYGNSVLVKNTKTGEKLRFSHLSRAGAKPGQRLAGGTVIGLSGSTGNSTGPHLDVEYYNNQGRLADVLKSPYASGLSGQGGGNPLQAIADLIGRGVDKVNNLPKPALIEESEQLASGTRYRDLDPELKKKAVNDSMGMFMGMTNPISNIANPRGPLFDATKKFAVGEAKMIEGMMSRAAKKGLIDPSDIKDIAQTFGRHFRKVRPDKLSAKSMLEEMWRHTRNLTK